MSLSTALAAAVQHRMRAYYLPFAAGGALAVSAFLPWVLIGDVALGGAPDLAGLWILGLGVLAMVLASLSIITRKNSRHPLLVVGLTALGIEFLAYQLLMRSAAERVWAASQARSIVDGTAVASPPGAVIGLGIYLGLGASLALVAFGLTIVLKRVSSPYARADQAED